jgi:hypothetical protein
MQGRWFQTYEGERKPNQLQALKCAQYLPSKSASHSEDAATLGLEVVVTPDTSLQIDCCIKISNPL